MADESLSPLDRLAAEHECERLIYRYVHLNDRGEYDALADLFVEDGSYGRPTAPDQPIVGRDAIRASYHARPKGRLSRHVCANVVIEVEGPDRARGHSYIVLYTAAVPESGVAKADPIQLVGAFDDVFVREDGAWKFKERRGSLAMSVGG